MGPSTAGLPLEVVVPLKIRTYHGTSDLDRFTALLLPSFDRFFVDKDDVEFVLVVPETDMSEIVGRIGDLKRRNMRVECENALCPSLSEESGWHKQQILKLAAAKIVTSEYYLLLDADVILKRPTRLADLLPGGKPILQKIGARHHWDWWVGSRKTLKSAVGVQRDSIVMDVTPNFLHRETCLALHEAIASRNNADEWDRFLFDTRQIGWTEFSLYWLYTLERGLDRDLYDWSSTQMYEFISEPGQLEPRRLRRNFSPDARSFFLVVQSNLNLDPAIVEARIRPYLKDPGTGRARFRLGGLGRLRDYLAELLLR